MKKSDRPRLGWHGARGEMLMKAKLIACIALTALIYAPACTPALAQGEWPVFRHDDQRTGLVDTLAHDVLGRYRPMPIWIFPYPREVGDPVDNDYAPASRDDPNFATQGFWQDAPLDGLDAYNDDYLFTDAAGLASASATWTFTFTGATAQTPADFRIYVWFPSQKYEGKTHCQDAHYTVTINSVEVGEYLLDQTYGGSWLGLGERAFHVPVPALPAVTQTIEVTLTNQTDERTYDGSLIPSFVVADAVMIEQDPGMVLSSPVVSKNSPLVLTCVTRNVSLEAVDEFWGAADLGFVHALGTETDSGIGAYADDRGLQKWQFPADDQHNWIEKGISSTPTIADLVTGAEAAVIPAADGTVYVLDTQTGGFIWRGPGYFLDDPDPGSAVNNAETWLVPTITRAGYQDYGGDTYMYVKAVRLDDSGATLSTIAWSCEVQKKGRYAVYAWIPPSTGTAYYIPDARYKITTPSTPLNGVTASANQRWGGRWARLGSAFSLEAQEHITIELRNETVLYSGIAPGYDPEKAYVVADAIKVVPADLGGFEFSSPIVRREAKPGSDPPAWADYVYVGTKTGRVYKLEIGQPDPVWTYPDPNDNTNPHPIGPVYASPTMNQAGDTLYIGSTDGHVYALLTSSQLDDRLQWVWPPKPALDTPVDPDNLPQVLPQITSTAAVGQYVYVGLGAWGSEGFDFDPEGRILALDQADGTPDWWYPAPTPGSEGVGAFVYASPLLMNTSDASGNVVPGLFIGSTDGRFYGINSQTGDGLIGSGVWGTDPAATYPQLGGGMYSSPAGTVVADTTDAENNPLSNTPMAFVGTDGARICRVNLGSTPERDWWWDLYGDVWSSPAIHAQRIYVGDMGGYTWAFSTRQDAAGTGVEVWNVGVGARPGTGGSDVDEDEDELKQEAKPQIDLFLKADYDAFMAAAKTSRDGAADIALPGGETDLHNLARGETDTSDKFKYEWGETMCIIVWGLLDPNQRYKDSANWKNPGEDGFTDKLESKHTVKVTIKSVDTGAGADVTEGFPIENKCNYFRKDNKAVFYTTLEYTLNGSVKGKLQAPGSEFEIFATEIAERPRSTDRKATSSEEVYVLKHPWAEGSAHQRFAINNPLGLISVDPSGVENLIGLDDNAGTTSRDSGFASENGNASKVPYPYEWAGYASHNTTSAARDVKVYDRSLLSCINERIRKFRLELYDLKWMGGRTQVVSPIDLQFKAWEVPPALSSTNTPNISEDYPDIPGRQLSTLVQGRDPSAEPVELQPGTQQIGDIPPAAGTWTAAENPASVTVSIPRFQPANMPASTGTTDFLPITGYKGTVYTYVDSNNDGHLQKPADPGMPTTSKKKDHVEAYREFTFGLHVPADRRARVEQTMIDIGEVPHGFGMVPDEAAGTPAPFRDNLDENLLSFAEWFRPFTAYNIGNTNLLNLRAGLLPNWPGLLSDVVQDPSAGPPVPPGALYQPSGPFGFYIPSGSPALPVANLRGPEACLTSSLDPLFWDDVVSPILAPNRSRTFHKARVGETEPKLTVPDLPERLYGRYPDFTLNPADYEPRVSAAVPLGQPAGRYFGPLTLFEDGGGNPASADGVYGAAEESLGNPIINLQVRVREARLTDGFTPGSVPHLDSGPVGPVITGDVTPAADMDPGTGNICLVWASSRYGKDILGNADPTATDPWYLHISKLEREPLGTTPTTPMTRWRFSSVDPTRWWSPTDLAAGPGAPFPSPHPVDLNSLFQREVQPESVRFTSPSIVNLWDPEEPRTWLFFGGQAQAVTSAATGSTGKQIAYKVFYTELASGEPTGMTYNSTSDWTMPKSGIRGAVTRFPFTSLNGDPMLWSFWYGGNSERLRIYYNANPEPDDAMMWTNEAQLPLPKGLSSAAEPSPVWRWWGNNIGYMLDVVYSGYSTYHKNSDIYLSRYKPKDAQASHKEGGHWPLVMVTLPSRGDVEPSDPAGAPGEELTRDATGAIWYSKDVDWASDFKVYVLTDRNNPATRHDLNVGRSTKDPTTGSMVFDYSGDPTLRSLFRAVVINPVAGTVRFLKAPEPTAAVIAEYRPRAYRLSVGDGIKADAKSDVSPCAVFDFLSNPRYVSTVLGNPFFVPSSWVSGNSPRTDRLWVFWRRPGLDKPGTGIHYKAFRYMVKLERQIGMDFGTKAPTISAVPEATQPVEVDWVKNTLYFTGEDAVELDLSDPSRPVMTPRKVTVSYRDSSGVQDSENYVIRLAEDGISRHGAGPVTFGTLTSVMVNEGQVNAFRDWDSNSVWVFWTSTRDGSTDVYYEAVSPRFYGQREY